MTLLRRTYVTAKLWPSNAARSRQRGDRHWRLLRCMSQVLADIVAKVENRLAIIFPPKDDVTGDRRSLYSQSHYQGHQ